MEPLTKNRLTSNRAVLENLAYIQSLEARTAALRESVYGWLAELAPERARQPEDIAALYRAVRSLAQEAPPEEPSLCTPDFARFCKRFAIPGMWEEIFYERKEESGDEPEEDPFLLYEDEPQEEEPVNQQSARTAYMQNGFTDKAWRQFAEVVPDMTAEYFTGYGAVCEEVYNGRCRYCILPIYTSADGQLLSFRKLIGKYDLKICLETEVETAEDTFMRFALLRRRLAGEENEPLPETVDISAVLPEEGAAGGLIAACEILDTVVNAVYTVPLEYADRTQEFCLTLRLSGENPKESLAALALFLEASGLRYTVVGLYRTI